MRTDSRDQHIVRLQMGSSAGLVGGARVASEALFAPGFLRERVMQGSPLAHPAFAAYLSRLDAAPAAAASRPAPPAARPGKEGRT